MSLNGKSLALILLILFLAGLFVTPGVSASWLWVIPPALLGLVLVKRFRRSIVDQDACENDSLADAYLPGRSPRADMERRWSRLGSARGRLLAGADPQSELAEQIQRRHISDYHSWLAPQDRAQAHDLQAPGAIAKRKRKPKRKRLG